MPSSGQSLIVALALYRSVYSVLGYIINTHDCLNLSITKHEYIQIIKDNKEWNSNGIIETD